MNITIHFFFNSSFSHLEEYEFIGLLCYETEKYAAKLTYSAKNGINIKSDSRVNSSKLIKDIYGSNINSNDCVKEDKDRKYEKLIYFTTSALGCVKFYDLKFQYLFYDDYGLIIVAYYLTILQNLESEIKQNEACDISFELAKIDDFFWRGMNNQKELFENEFHLYNITNLKIYFTCTYSPLKDIRIKNNNNIIDDSLRQSFELHCEEWFRQNNITKNNIIFQEKVAKVVFTIKNTTKPIEDMNKLLDLFTILSGNRIFCKEIELKQDQKIATVLYSFCHINKADQDISILRRSIKYMLFWRWILDNRDIFKKWFEFYGENTISRALNFIKIISLEQKYYPDFTLMSVIACMERLGYNEDSSKKDHALIAIVLNKSSEKLLEKIFNIMFPNEINDIKDNLITYNKKITLKERLVNKISFDLYGVLRNSIAHAHKVTDDSTIEKIDKWLLEKGLINYLILSILFFVAKKVNLTDDSIYYIE